MRAMLATLWTVAALCVSVAHAEDPWPVVPSIDISGGLPADFTEASSHVVEGGTLAAGASPKVKRKDKVTSSNLNTKVARPGGGLVDEWEHYMDGFTPDILLTFPLAARTDELFYEEVTPPFVLRGGFFASSSEETSSVDFKIENPVGEVVFEKVDEAEGLFHFVAKKKGTYTFTVSNNRWMEEKTVTFALGRGNDTNIKGEHVDAVDQQIEAISRELRDIQTESTYLWIRQKSHMKAVESIHRRVFWFCVVEFLILIGMAGLQAYYIKGMLSDRRVL